MGVKPSSLLQASGPAQAQAAVAPILSGQSNADSLVNAALASNPVTGWVNPVLGAIGLGSVGGLFGNGDRDKSIRDHIIGTLVDKGVLTQDSNGSYLTLPDGSKFNIGSTAQTGTDAKGDPMYAWETNMQDPKAVALAKELDPMVVALTGGQRGNAESQLMGLLTNAALSSGNSQKNVDAIYKDFGMDPASTQAALDQSSLSDADKQSLLAQLKGANIPMTASTTPTPAPLSFGGMTASMLGDPVALNSAQSLAQVLSGTLAPAPQAAQTAAALGAIAPSVTTPQTGLLAGQPQGASSILSMLGNLGM